MTQAQLRMLNEIAQELSACNENGWTVHDSRWRMPTFNRLERLGLIETRRTLREYTRTKGYDFGRHNVAVSQPYVEIRVRLTEAGREVAA